MSKKKEEGESPSTLESSMYEKVEEYNAFNLINVSGLTFSVNDA